MPKIFISYRRSDSEDIAGRICDRLAAHFGKDSIFFDVDAIPFGEDLRDYINASLDQCQVVLAVIGKTWLTVTDENGNRRLDNPADWVRLELEEALKRKGEVSVIPLLVSRATLPAADEMPPALVDLAYRNAAQARPDPDFHGDISRLIVQLEQYFDRLNATPSPTSTPAVEPNATAHKPPSVVGWAPPTNPKPANPTFEAPPTSPKPANLTFEFEVVTITGIEKGFLGLGQPKVITNRRRAKAEYFVETLATGVSLEMVKIPAGQFLMGSPSNEEGRSDAEDPQHLVTVPKFWLGKYPVTQAQYHVVMGSNPSRFAKDGANRPVEKVSWYDAAAFCKMLSKQTGRTYCLPSEAEWEYACRAGTMTPYHYGPTITTDLANYDGNYTYDSGPKGFYRETPTDVGCFEPNPFGLYDMHGNVWEGALTTGMTITLGHQQTVQRGCLMMMPQGGLGAAALGPRIRGSAALRSVIPLGPAKSPTVLVFGSRVPLRGSKLRPPGLSCPLPSCPLALYKGAALALPSTQRLKKFRQCMIATRSCDIHLC